MSQMTEVRERTQKRTMYTTHQKLLDRRLQSVCRQNFVYFPGQVEAWRCLILHLRSYIRRERLSDRKICKPRKVEQYRRDRSLEIGKEDMTGRKYVERLMHYLFIFYLIIVRISDYMRTVG